MDMGQKTHAIEIHAEITPVVNYALQQNRLPVIREVVIKNGTQTEFTNVILHIWSEPPVVSSFSQTVSVLPAEESLSLKRLPLTLNHTLLASLTERVVGTLSLSLETGGVILSELRRELIALAFDEWHGPTFFPDLLAAFVTPNHPEIVKINAKAAELLEQWTGDPSLNAYQTQNPNRVRLQAAAVYGALQALNLVYAMPPASFEAVGQRVRLCDAVIRQRMGTCLDLSLLYAACLEAIGLHPLLLLQPGHVFTGVWLEDLTFPDAVQDDPSLLTKRLADGINEITVVECTACTSGKGLEFERAVQAAIQELAKSPLDYFIDVVRARLSGIRPLPMRVATDRGWEIPRRQLEGSRLTSPPAALGETVVLAEAAPAPAGKIAQWERRLLELGLRNTLINLRLTQNVIPILSPSLADLEDALADGSEYGIRARPAEWKCAEADRKNMETMTDIGPYKALIQSEFQNKRLRTILGEGELARAMVNLYRSAKNSLEENGANTLYLALGLLRWYETKRSQKARYAPIILLPVEIIRKSALQGYVIRLREEEPQVNITLLEMLKQDFGISVCGLDPLPQDEHGTDMRAVLAVLRKAVMDQHGWDVLESSFLGIFSFSQFVMWNDLHNRWEDLQKNKLVKSLIDGKLSWDAAPMEIGSRVPEEGVLLPIPADASQLYAIEAAARGDSFVLHGPPGTGKSQTITAMIANALAQGQRVLFVAEKMAALSVVQRRLDAMGIGAFCLELHSNKSKKRDVLEQLRGASEVTRLQPAETFAAKGAQIKTLREELNAYAEALHRPRVSGLSLFEMVNGYERYSDAPDCVHFPANFAAKADKAQLERQRLLVERLIAAAKALGHPHGHPLSPVCLSGYTRGLRAALPERLRGYQDALGRLLDAGTKLSNAWKIPLPNRFAQWLDLNLIAQNMAVWLPAPRAWAKYTHVASAMRDIEEMCRHYQSAGQLAKELCSAWKEEFLHQDGAALLEQWRQVSARWLLPRLLGQNRLVKQVAPFSAAPLDKSTLGGALEALTRYQRELAAAEALFSTYGTDLCDLFAGPDTDWPAVEDLARAVSGSAAELQKRTENEAIWRSFAAKREWEPAIAETIRAFSAVCEARSALYQLLSMEEDSFPTENWLPVQQQMCREISNHADMLREWTLWKHLCGEAQANALAPLVSAYENGLEHAAVEAAYYKGLYRALIEDVVDHDSVLQTFSGAVFHQKIAQFRRMDQEFLQLTKTELFYRLASKVPNFAKEAAQSSEVGILQRAIRSGGRGVSIRRLFEQIPNLLPRLCPCMLMSPISAAQYLDPRREPFDIVMFDEASQLPTCKAVGVLARGRNAIIVGDPKQMPPTSFFAGNRVDEEHLDEEDLESILEDCLALNMPQTHLLWHYRSRHESLIAFSNHQFYENKLYTFPSVNDLESKVSLIHVDGFFDRGKTRQNRAEAEAIVKELQRRCHTPECAGQSIGVVTFNINQQNLIDDLLTEASKTDPELESWAYERDEPLFIKNLENVQGDERDVILFSISYGPDPEGRVSMNFGPLNREGGWRRLNVAVSRARQEMLVFATLTPEQIDLSRTSSAGVAALKAFLEYAGGSPLSSDETTSLGRPTSSGIVPSICQCLQEAGYACRAMVGRSCYRVDVGIIDPAQPDRYLLGVLLDGPMYGASKTTRDREIAQPDVLKGLGWKLHRIWTADWWDNRARELDRLLEHVKEAVAEAEHQKSLPVHQEASVPDAEKSDSKIAAGYRTQVPGAVPAAPAYRVAKLPTQYLPQEEYLFPERAPLLKELLEQVIKVEAPISEGMLTRRVLQSLGIARAGSRIQAHTSALLRQMQVRSTIQDGQRFYWGRAQAPDAYQGYRVCGAGIRDAKDVPVQEAANAVCQVLSEQIGLPRADLIRETAKLLGYTRSGTIVASMVQSGIQLALDTHRISEEQDGGFHICD